MSSVDELALAGDDEEDVLVEELLGAVDELELDDDDEDSCILGAERCIAPVEELEPDEDDDEDSCILGAERCIAPVEELEPDEDDDEDSCILGAECCIAPVEELEPDEDGEFVKESNDCVKLGDLVGSDVASSDAASVFPFLLITGAAPLEVRRFIVLSPMEVVVIASSVPYTALYKHTCCATAC